MFENKYLADLQNKDCWNNDAFSVVTPQTSKCIIV